MKRIGILWLALGVVGCGFSLDIEPIFEKADGIHVQPVPLPPVEMLPHTLPRKPRALTGNALPSWTSGRALAVHQDQLFAVDSDNHQLVVLNRHTRSIERTIALGLHPEQVVVDSDGNAFVTVRDQGTVVRIEHNTETVTVDAAVGADPTGLALSPDGQQLFVLLRAEGTLLTLDSKDLSELHRIEGRLNRPQALAVTETTITIVHQGEDFIQFGRSNETGLPNVSTVTSRALRSQLPWDHSLASTRVKATTPNRGRAVTIRPENGEAWVVHQQTITGNVETLAFDVVIKQLLEESLCGSEGEEGQDCADIKEPVSGGGSGYGGLSTDTAPGLVRPIETVVTESGNNFSNVETSLLPTKAPGHEMPMGSRVAQPTDIHHHPTWTMAFVTGYGSDNVLVLNTDSMDPMAHPIALIDVGAAPKAIAFSDDGQWAYTLNHHDFTISAIDLAPLFQAIEAPVDTEEIANFAFEFLILTDPINIVMFPVIMGNEDHQTFPFGTDPLDEAARVGRRIYTHVFNDKINSDGRFACASCHFEGGQDQLVWATPDGIRQTPSLSGRLFDTAPFNWGGTESTLTGNMTQTISRMSGDGLSDEELASLEQFLINGLKRPVNPYRLPTGLTQQQQWGAELFNSPAVGCAVCHNGPAYTDGKFYSVGTDTNQEFEMQVLLADLMGNMTEPQAPKYNTPSLRDLFATAPYFHNGTADTLMDVLDQTATTMGHTAQLTLEEKEALVAYLLTL